MIRIKSHYDYDKVPERLSDANIGCDMPSVEVMWLWAKLAICRYCSSGRRAEVSLLWSALRVRR